MSNDNEVVRYVLMGTGAAIGAGLTLLGHTLWTMTAGVAAEKVREQFEGWQQIPIDKPPVPRPAEPNNAARVASWDATYPMVKRGGILRILISDQHIDTWGELEKYATVHAGQPPHPDYKDCPGLSCRAVDFIELLKTLRALSEDTDSQGNPRYEHVDLYINGDLTDIPLHKAHAGADEPDDMIFDDTYGGHKGKNGTWQGVLPKSLDVILRALRDSVKDTDPRLRIFYITGNHDIGISGLRYFRADAHRQPPVPPDPSIDVLDLPFHAVWNPGAIIRTRDKWVYLEHGHLHDPILWLYLRYATLDLLRGGSRRQERQLLGRMQRNGQFGQNAHDEQEKNGQSQFAPGDSRVKDYITIQIARRYRHAARRTARWLNYIYGPQPFTIVLGHTHIEDKMTFEYNGTTYIYINAGSWAGNQHHQTFWTIESTGDVRGPFQWPA